MKVFFGYFLFIVVMIVLAFNPITGPLMSALGVVYEYALYILIGGIGMLILVGGILERRKG